MKKRIKPFELSENVLNANLLIATKLDKEVNIMTLGWRSLGTLWSKPVWIVAVKPSRHTFKMLNQNPEFTLHLMPDDRSDVMNVAGSKSGRDMDKVKELGLTLKSSKKVSVPLIEEALISYECKIIHTTESGKNAPHRLYFGQIKRSYAEESLLR